MGAEAEKRETVPAEDFAAESSPANAVKEEGGAFKAYLRIFSYGGTFERILQAVALICAVGSGAGIALQNLIFGSFVTTIQDFTTGKSTPDHFRGEVSKLALYFVYLGIARFALSYGYISLTTFSAYRITRNLRHKYLHAALRQEVAFYDFGTGGSIATQAISNGRLIQAGIAEKLALTFQGLAVFVTAFIISFITQWKLTLIVVGIAPLILVVMGVASTFEAALETKILDTYAQAGSFSEGILASARTVHAFEIRSRLVQKFDKFLQDAHNLGNKKSPLFGILFSFEYFVIYAGFALAFWQGIHMMNRGEITESGDIFTVLLSVVIGTTALTMLTPYIIEFTRAASAAAQLFKLIDRPSEIDPFDKSGEQPTDTVGVVDLENITFSYPTRPGVTVLDNFSLHIPAGKVTALVGSSGSGKSTIIGLIERWYNPKAGTIKLDGKPIDRLNLNWLRKNVRLVQQEPILFQGTVFDNIANGLVGTQWENAPREEQMQRVQEAAKIAFAHDFVSQLPEGYDTMIGERGGLLSGGQKQRVAIARSIISQPKVLLLDEATSALDPHAEGVVQQALDKASEGRTTITIAHKLATIRKADNIVVMNKGKIVEQGTHEGLLKQDGAYTRLVRAQNLSVSEEGSITETEGDDDDSAPKENIEMTKTMSRYRTADQTRMELQKERDNYDHHKQQGLISVVIRMVRETPELNWAYFGTLVAVVVAAGAFPGQSLIIANLVDVFTLTGSEMISKGNFYSLMFFVLALGVFVCYFAMGWTTNTIAQGLNHKLRKQALNDFLRQDLQFFDRRENNTGALASKLESNPQSILELMGFNIGLILISTLNVVACSILAIATTWKLGLVVVLAGLPPLVSSGYIKVRLDSKLDNSTSKRYSASAAIASESVTAIRTVSSLAIEESVLKRYTDELDHAVRASTAPLFTMTVAFGLTQCIEYFFMALGFWYGCRLLSFNEISMYQFFVAFMGTFFSGQAAAQLFQYSSSMTKGINAANYLFWLHDLQPTIQETPDNHDKAPKSGTSLDFDHLKFSYPLRPEAHVLRGVDLEIKKGQFVALVGASGCGKSTMIAMLERFYDPTTGTIRIDGDAALSELNPRLYRQFVALVQQEPTLFQGSIRENIALGIDSDSLTDVTDAQIEQACRAANAWDFVSSLPEGLGTPCGSSGMQLSGGQRQRIAIARALIRNPRILLLDEATSALDTESEKIVQRALNEAARDGERITIAVAHRLSTVKDADIICVFYGGRIVEKGTHAQLVAKGGMYKQMCEAQNLE
ncbi:Leptomycin B resistance protein pmd1 [Colletotrichum fructicola]|uniref:Leptomycin B resistance protein pmd1 n=1 Tax=Colletotrichum fructicola (strain Nara gc5) TaxID=1213859 RepID=L2GEB3_COLFN|nr:Leptomycin B resistance protein pmd1 [Colletotrichum fructicola]KAE9581925.1 Leptomycin B resistance protein pmd1 [Colletotrichum fructicola]KAF4411794.1 Leptomycin B resistance protein pmd1 [Colletotrichum fructicola]KAF4489878.1 Leptomycin B resistance protein pmd1 [Colletotrichum fructicola Nara gc5]KAF4906267.1 Leptomycin B resistance protein pmd1 [Colletotrichum fructicola]